MWENSKDFYDKHADSILKTAKFYHTGMVGNTDEEFLLYVIRKARINNFSSVLDLGCGSGYLVDRLSLFCKAVGISNSEKAVEQCKLNYPNSDYRAGDMESYTVENYTHLLALESIGYADIRNTFINAFKCLKPGGFFYIKHFFIPWYEDPKMTENRQAFEKYWHYIPSYFPDFVSMAYECGFELVESRDLTQMVNTKPFEELNHLHLEPFELPHPDISFILPPIELLFRRFKGG